MGRSSVQTAIVVGAGIAGIAAAVRLAEAGVRVTLLETRKKLGGRATSFDDVRSGRTLDNCQHVVLGCCTNYLDLLRRLSADHHISWTHQQYWFEAGDKAPSLIARSPLPAPGHYAFSMLHAPMLTKGELVALARACLAILRTDRAKERSRTFAAFLNQHRQPERLIRRFWSPVVISACNLDVDRVASSSAIHVFQEGFLATSTSANVGVSDVPLARLYDRALDLIAKPDGQTILGAGVKSLDARRVQTTDGRAFEGDAVVCAVPIERVNRVVDPACREHDARFDRLDEFTHSPILGVHLSFDRPAMPDHPHAVLVDRPTQWLFRKNQSGTDVHAVISAADAWLELDEQAIAERVLADMRACLPAFHPKGRSDEPRVTFARAVKEKLATFAPIPGLDAIRPSPAGESGVYLAGDYTDTGWPATMEGAARSGYAAAAAVLGMPATSLVLPPLKPALLARVLGLRYPEPS